MTNDNSANQRKRLLEYFHSQEPRITVGEAREILGIMSPPARVLELRARGYNIATYWHVEIDRHGRSHRNGIYVYLGKKRGEDVQS
ncbi:MAG: hypothetical protein GY821_06270 [Gammaproteobacteria bacterium]|nr:hypothetical protein [Gammaproteobacteria bacterium]